MMWFILRRALWGVLVVMSVVTLVFFLIFVAGDPAVTILGPQARAEQIADFEAKKGLDQPIATQFLSYLGVLPCVRRDSPKYERDDGSRAAASGSPAGRRRGRGTRRRASRGARRRSGATSSSTRAPRRL